MSRDVIDIGAGPPLVLIPGIQGRWEWMRPAVKALARNFRVLTFTLSGEWTSRHAFDPALGFDNYVVQLDRALDAAGVTSATLCGISYGGLVALRYAAKRPARVRHLVLASALPPDYVPDHRYRLYKRAPALMFPLFLFDSSRRLAPEVRASFPRWLDRARFSVAQGVRVLSAPASPWRMRDRMELLAGVDFSEDASRISSPTLVLTGAEDLDRTVPPALTRRYLDRIPGAVQVLLDRTGHLGTVTRPREFARLVTTFTTSSTGSVAAAMRQERAG